MQIVLGVERLSFVAVGSRRGAPVASFFAQGRGPLEPDMGKALRSVWALFGIR